MTIFRQTVNCTVCHVIRLKRSEMIIFAFMRQLNWALSKIESTLKPTTTIIKLNQVKLVQIHDTIFIEICLLRQLT